MEKVDLSLLFLFIPIINCPSQIFSNEHEQGWRHRPSTLHYEKRAARSPYLNSGDSKYSWDNRSNTDAYQRFIKPQDNGYTRKERQESVYSKPQTLQYEPKAHRLSNYYQRPVADGAGLTEKSWKHSYPQNALTSFEMKHQVYLNPIPLESKASCPSCEDIVKPNPLSSVFSFYLSGELLLWQTNDHIVFGVDEKTGQPSRVKQVWKPGVRVGIGYIAPYQWDIGLYWTYYTNSGKISDRIEYSESLEKSSSTSKENNNLIYEFFQPIKKPFANQSYTVNGNTNNIYSLSDLELSRAFLIDWYLTLRPFLGLRTAFLTQKQDILYEEFFTPSTRAPIRAKQEFSGVGPKFGMNFKWALFQDFYLLNRTSTAILYGKRYHFLSSPELTPLYTELTYINDQFYQIIPNLEFFLGLGWETIFCSSKMFSIQIGWETSFWWDTASNFAWAERSLGIQGWNFKVSFGF